MSEQLFALKRDVDKLTEDMLQLAISYNTVDYIAYKVKNLWDEQQCQAAQMRRIEGRLDALEDGMAKVEERLNKVEERLDKMEVLLLKIVKHLGIS